ncbi:MAG TPA: hypothetical protein VEH28_05225 [Thermoplasmata archaeon]|nr:hypothetical protein [Thermoplasmata archaeon]
MIVVVAVVAVAGLLAAVLVPVNSESKEIQLTSSSGASATLSLPQSAWVTVHFSHSGNMPMMYSMNGPGGGMMFNHHGMMGADTYSFWSNGGNYQCWAGYEGQWRGMSPVWVNATWGVL